MSTSTPQKAKRYHAIKLVLSIVHSALFVVYAAAWTQWGPIVLAHLPTDGWLLLLAFAVSFLFGFELLIWPLEYYGSFVIEHRFEMSNQHLGRWFSQQVKGWLVGGVLAGALVCGVYALLWHAGSWWWLWVLVGWLMFTVGIAQLSPIIFMPIFYKSEPLQDQALISRLESMANDAGMRIEGVYRLELSSDTKAVNAMLTGLGRTRRVYLSDTLLETFEPDEIEIVFAHELGHHVRHHMVKNIALATGIGLANVLILKYFLHDFHGAPQTHWHDAIMALPTVVLSMAMLSLVVKPVGNAISRRYERQCDQDALQRTGNHDAYRRTFRRLAETNLADQDPHPLIEWYFHDHPAISKRIAMADTI